VISSESITFREKKCGNKEKKEGREREAEKEEKEEKR